MTTLLASSSFASRTSASQSAMRKMPKSKAALPVSSRNFTGACIELHHAAFAVQRNWKEDHGFVGGRTRDFVFTPFERYPLRMRGRTAGHTDRQRARAA